MKNQNVVVVKRTNGDALSFDEEQQLIYQIADEALLTRSVIHRTTHDGIFHAKFTVDFRSQSYDIVVPVSKNADGLYDFFSIVSDDACDGEHDARKELVAHICHLLESPSYTDFVSDTNGIVIYYGDASDISADVFSDIVGRVEAIENAILSQNPRLSIVA